jgi:hypothetical protein
MRNNKVFSLGYAGIGFRNFASALFCEFGFENNSVVSFWNTSAFQLNELSS